MNFYIINSILGQNHHSDKVKPLLIIRFGIYFGRHTIFQIIFAVPNVKILMYTSFKTTVACGLIRKIKHFNGNTFHFSRHAFYIFDFAVFKNFFYAVQKRYLVICGYGRASAAAAMLFIGIFAHNKYFLCLIFFQRKYFIVVF